MAFTGKYRHTIDAKGRLIIPSRIREEMEDSKLLLMPSPDPCISLWCGAKRTEYEERLQSQSKSSNKNRAVIRELYAHSHSDEVDKQNRITIPEELREVMGIGKEVLILGAGDHAEIWDPARYEQERAEVKEVGLSALFGELDI